MSSVVSDLSGAAGATALFSKQTGQYALQLNCNVVGNIMTMTVGIRDNSGRAIATVRAAKIHARISPAAQSWLDASGIGWQDALANRINGNGTTTGMAQWPWATYVDDTPTRFGAIAYGLALFPMGMLADRFDNKKLVMLGAADRKSVV